MADSVMLTTQYVSLSESLRKSQVVESYNQNKLSLDMSDQMAFYSISEQAKGMPILTSQ